MLITIDTKKTPSIRAITDQVILSVYKDNKQNKTHTAEALDMSLRGIRYCLRRIKEGRTCKTKAGK